MADGRTAVALRLYFAAIALFLAAPLIVVAGVSCECRRRRCCFRRRASRSPGMASCSPTPDGASALLASLSIAALSAALAVAVALPLAWFTWRRIAPWTQIFMVLGVAPFMLPPVITALGFLSFWATLGFYGQPWTAVISHAIFFVTLPLVTLSLGFASIDRSLVEAAATMGADRPHRLPHHRLATDPALYCVGFRLRIRAVAQRIYRRLYDCRLHHGDAADQDLQRAPLRIHADHGRRRGAVRRCWRP